MAVSGLARTLLIITTIIIALLAFASFWMVVHAYVYFRDMFSLVLWSGVAALVLLLIACALMIAVAICGLCGACLSSTCCLVFFLIFSLVWIGIMMALGIVAAAVPPKYLSKTNDNLCLTQTKLDDMRDFNVNAATILCKSCACYFPKSVDGTVYTATQQSTLTTTQAPSKSTTNVALPVRTQDCVPYTSTYSRGDELMAYFEKKWQCTGWCANTGSLFYRFTDVNNGKPKYTCFSRVSERIRHYTRVIYALAFTLMSLFILGWILALCLCCTMRRRSAGYGYGVPYPPMAPVAAMPTVVTATPVSQTVTRTVLPVAQSMVSYGY